MRVLIDGDPIVYRAGFSAQNNWKILTWCDASPDAEFADCQEMGSFVDDEASGTIWKEFEAFFAYVYEMENFIEEYNLHPDEYQVSEWVDPLPENYCLHIVKENLKNICTAIEGYLREEDVDTDNMEVELYLSGKRNFRNKIATIPTFKRDGTEVLGYKANRKDTVRPHWYQRIRDYMVEHWDAQIFEDIEADDALAIEQWEQDPTDPQTIICTIDKDLQNVPGWHYNVLKKKDKLMTFGEATVHFYKQCVTGDSVDNIPGCYRVRKARLEALTPDMSAEEMYNFVLDIYVENISKFPQRHGPYGEMAEEGRTTAAAKLSLLENARLLWMLQHKDQLWTPPGEPDGSILEEGFVDEQEEWA